MTEKSNKESASAVVGTDEEDQSRPKFRAFWDFWSPILVTFSFCIGIRHFIVEPRYIPSGSMLPSLQIKDRLLVEKLTFLRRSPNRGEVVVFNSPYMFDKALRSKRSPSSIKCAMINLPLLNVLTGLSDPACDDYIKRVVAVAGDRVSINRQGYVTVNDRRLFEPYVSDYCDVNQRGLGECKSLSTTVPLGHLLVLGDNRKKSWDSRYWPGGPFLPEKEVFGRAIVRFWPAKRIGFIGL